MRACVAAFVVVAVSSPAHLGSREGAASVLTAVLELATVGVRHEPGVVTSAVAEAVPPVLWELRQRRAREVGRALVTLSEELVASPEREKLRAVEWDVMR